MVTLDIISCISGQTGETNEVQTGQANHVDVVQQSRTAGVKIDVILIY